MTTTGATAGTMTTEPVRAGLSVRTRITAAVALLVTVALAGAGLIVYWGESRALTETLQSEVEQELDEFVALQRTGDNRTEAAELLGLSRRTLQRKLQEMGKVKRIRRRSPTHGEPSRE